MSRLLNQKKRLGVRERERGSSQYKYSRGKISIWLSIENTSNTFNPLWVECSTGGGSLAFLSARNVLIAAVYRVDEHRAPHKTFVSTRPTREGIYFSGRRLSTLRHATTSASQTRLQDKRNVSPRKPTLCSYIF